MELRHCSYLYGVSFSDDSFTYGSSDGHEGVQYERAESVDLLKNKQTWRRASIRWYGPNGTHPCLNIEELKKQRDGSWGFRTPAGKIALDDKQIAILQLFLAGEFPESGPYRLTAAVDPDLGTVLTNAQLVGLVAQIRSGNVHAATLIRLVVAMSRVDGLGDLLADADEGALLTGLVERHRRQKQLAALRAIVEDPTSTETDVHKVMKKDWWIFGGQFMEQYTRRKLDALHEMDFPLLRGDGSLQVVELKGPNVPSLVVDHRSEGDWVVGKDINLAVGQVMNYMRAFEFQRDHFKNRPFNVEVGRCRATVVIGYLKHVTTGASKDEIRETLRTYNSHLARVEVITYNELLDNAARSLALTGQGMEPGTGQDSEASDALAA